MADIGRLLAAFAGGALEGGVNAFDYNKQQEEKKRQQAIQDAERLQHDLLFKQGQEDRTRQHAATAYQTLQQQGQQALTQGNYGQAQQLMPKMYENLNAATGLDLVGPRLAGKMVGTGQEQARPNQGFTGPMPEKLTMGATPDLSNPKNKASLDAVFGYTPPAPKPVKIGRTVGHYDTAGKFIVDREEEDPMADYRNESLQLRRDALEASKANAAQASADRAASRAVAASNHVDSRRRRTTTATIEMNGKPTTVLIDAETGDVIKEVGVKPTTPRAPAAPKPFDPNKAWTEAKNEFPDNAMGGANAETIAKRKALVEQRRREHVAAQRAASGEKSMTQKLVEMMEAEKAARKK